MGPEAKAGEYGGLMMENQQPSLLATPVVIVFLTLISTFPIGVVGYWSHTTAVQFERVSSPENHANPVSRTATYVAKTSFSAILLRGWFAITVRSLPPLLMHVGVNPNVYFGFDWAKHSSAQLKAATNEEANSPNQKPVQTDESDKSNGNPSDALARELGEYLKQMRASEN